MVLPSIQPAHHDQQMELKLATIKCKKCEEESYIESWKLGTDDLGNLVRVCNYCGYEEII